MKHILLDKGKKVIVDDEDFEKLNHQKWFFGARGYAIRTEHRGYTPEGKRLTGTIWMHREIMQTPEGLFTDHVNGDTLDNRKSNLRVVTAAQNTRNSKTPTHNTSGFKGVSEDKRNLKNKWQSYITINNKKHHIGYFPTKEDAAEAYNRTAREIFGEYARLNNLILFEYEHYSKVESVREKIQSCENRHTQQAIYSTFHDGLTQICFGCRKIRSTIFITNSKK